MKKKLFKKKIHEFLNKMLDKIMTYQIIGGIAVIFGLIVNAIISTIINIEAIFVYAAIIAGVFLITELILLVLLIVFIALDL